MYGKSALRTINDSKLNLKHNSFEDCMIIGQPQLHVNQTKGHIGSSFLKAEGEERTSGNTLGTKRLHVESNSISPRVSNAKSPSSNKNVGPDTCGSFVTARAKLVSSFTILSISVLPLFSFFSFLFLRGYYFISKAYHCILYIFLFSKSSGTFKQASRCLHFHCL